MAKVGAVALSLALLVPASSVLSQGGVRADMSGKGAVLCAWQIYKAAETVGSECHPGENALFQAELANSLDKIDDFIVANSKQPISKAALKAKQVDGFDHLKTPKDICTSGAANIYRALEAQGTMKLHAAVSDLLSVPREPLINPCL